MVEGVERGSEFEEGIERPSFITGTKTVATEKLFLLPIGADFRFGSPLVPIFLREVSPSASIQKTIINSHPDQKRILWQ
jgi:hypothetical protein